MGFQPPGESSRLVRHGNHQRPDLQLFLDTRLELVSPERNMGLLDWRILRPEEASQLMAMTHPIDLNSFTKRS